MSSSRTPVFAARPGTPDLWVWGPDRQVRRHTDSYTARLSVEVTPALRGRIKVTVFQRHQTVADMLHGLLEREFPAEPAP